MFFYIPFCQEISNINLPFLFYKVFYYIQNCLINVNAEMQQFVFVNRQTWLPPSDNYKTNVLVQSDIAGHYRAIRD